MNNFNSSYQGVPGTGVLDTGLDLSCGLAASLTSSFLTWASAPSVAAGPLFSLVLDTLVSTPAFVGDVTLSPVLVVVVLVAELAVVEVDTCAAAAAASSAFCLNRAAFAAVKSNANKC